MNTQEGIGHLFALPPLALTVPEFPQVPTHPRIEIPPLNRMGNFVQPVPDLHSSKAQKWITILLEVLSALLLLCRLRGAEIQAQNSTSQFIRTMTNFEIDFCHGHLVEVCK